MFCLTDQMILYSSGNWTTWSSWECSSKCPNGTQYRSRDCTNPVPEVGGDLCLMTNGSRSAFESVCGGADCCPGKNSSDFILLL